MSTLQAHRHQWAIDRTLEGLLGQDVRAAAKSFAPALLNGAKTLRFLPVRDLYLPDNTQPAGLPVFFEGRLLEFERQIGVVFVRLDSPALPYTSEGAVLFRGRAVVIVRGPAAVELTSPFQVERLPTDVDNYWRDLRLPCAQFEFGFPEDKTAPEQVLNSAGHATAASDFAPLRGGH